MKNTQQLTSEQLGNAWPDMPAPKDRKPVDFLAIDNAKGVTVATIKLYDPDTTNKSPEQLKQAYASAYVKARLLRPKGGCIREVHLTEENYRQDDEKKRDRFWQDALYKPTACRRLHHR